MPMWVMSGRAIPRSFRFMEGFGVHTFRLVNAAGKPAFVKFGWKPKQGLQSVLWNEAVKINGADPDFHRRDLRDAIGRGDLPEWELGLQLFDEEFADRFGFDVLDPARIIPEEEVPIRRVGRLVLDRVLDNVFAEPSRWRSARRTPCPASTSATTHYSQARQFFISQTQVEQQHVIDAFVFELSKCERPGIGQRIVAGLRNVHQDLASAVAAGRKIGVLVTDGIDAADGTQALASMPAAREFITDAYAHREFIGYTEHAMPLFQACGVDSRLDDGFIAMDQTTPAQFITSCAKLRFWERQP
jgi:catalase